MQICRIFFEFLGRYFLVVIFLLVSFSIAPIIAADGVEEPLKIVFIAYENPEQLVEDVKPVVNYLTRTLGMPVKYFVATDYAGVVEALRNDSADMGFMGPLQYIMAHAQAGAYAILGEVYRGKPSYVARIFVRKDSSIKSLADLRGKSIAFVDPISSSGYMYPLDIFVTEKLLRKGGSAEAFFKKVYFAGGDEQAISAVYNRFVDAAGIGQYSFNLLRPDQRDSIKIIGESKTIPSHCVVVCKGLDKKTVSKLKEALLALNDGPNRSLLRYLYSVDGYVEVDHSVYAETERMAREYGFLPSPTKGKK